MSDPRFVEAVNGVKHDEGCGRQFVECSNGRITASGPCDCTRDARIAAGLEEACLIAALPGGSHNDPDVLEAFTSASAPKEP